MDVDRLRLERFIRRDQVVMVHSRRVTNSEACKLAFQRSVLERITL
jgi:hypothetical protein